MYVEKLAFEKIIICDDIIRKYTPQLNDSCNEKYNQLNVIKKMPVSNVRKIA